MSAPLIKRLMGELRILSQNRVSFVQGVQDPNNIKIFYFLMRPDDAPYKGGLYIGQIEVPDEYPTKAPVFKILTPSGRFEVNKAICMTNSHYHPEHSTAAWNINTMIIAFVSIFIEDDTTGISHIKDTKENRKYMAENSHQYNIQYNSRIYKLFDQFINEDFSLKTEEEINQYIEASKPVKKAKKTEQEKEAAKEELKIAVDEVIKLHTKAEVKAEIKEEVKEVKPEIKEEVKEEVKEVEVKEVKPNEPPPVKVARKNIKATKPAEPVVEQVPDVEPVPVVEQPNKKVVKRVAKPKPLEETQQDEPELKPKKVVKRVVKPKPVEEKEQHPEQPEQQEQEKPKKTVVKKVIKKVVKKVVKPADKYEVDDE